MSQLWPLTASPPEGTPQAPGVEDISYFVPFLLPPTLCPYHGCGRNGQQGGLGPFLFLWVLLPSLPLVLEEGTSVGGATLSVWRKLPKRRWSILSIVRSS